MNPGPLQILNGNLHTSASSSLGISLKSGKGAMSARSTGSWYLHGVNMNPNVKKLNMNQNVKRIQDVSPDTMPHPLCNHTALQCVLVHQWL